MIHVYILVPIIKLTSILVATPCCCRGQIYTAIVTVGSYLVNSVTPPLCHTQNLTLIRITRLRLGFSLILMVYLYHSYRGVSWCKLNHVAYLVLIKQLLLLYYGKKNSWLEFYYYIVCVWYLQFTTLNNHDPFTLSMCC